MADNRALLAVLLLGGVALYLWSRNAQEKTQNLLPDMSMSATDAQEGAAGDAARKAQPDMTMQAQNVVPITAARGSAVAQRQVAVVSVANPLRADPSAKNAARAYRMGGVNYWLVTLAGQRYYMNDAEIARYGAKKT